MLNVLNKIFGNKHEKDVKALRPIVDEINEIYDKLHALSEEELKNKTNEFRNIIKERTKDFEEEKTALRTKLREDDLNSLEIVDVTERIKKIQNELYEETQSVLNELLPEAFAVVKETCRRLTESRHSFEYAGNKDVWDMIPYDVQLIGGIVIHQGKIAEMATGEGKTLVAVAPVYLNALAGKGVHLVTVNDYLAKRDRDWMSPVYDYLGLTSGAMQGNMDNNLRKKIYNMDISYGTNNEFGFDYLRDNMVTDAEHMVQREHWFAIVDEVDSVLIDEARTPLIISGPVGQTDQKYEEMNPRVRKVVNAQNQIVNSFMLEAQQLLDKKDKESVKHAGVLLLRASRGLPKHKRLMKLMQDPDLQKLRRDTEMEYLRDKGSRMHEIDDELYYAVDEKNHTIDLTDKGRDLLTSAQEDKDMFVIPDIAAELSQLEGDSAIEEKEKQRRIDAIYVLYAERSDRIHTLTQLLKAYTLYEIDNEYVVKDSKVLIVDEFTGRIMDGRRYSDGLHQAIEAKENVKVERDTQTLATITLQNYFRLYQKLAGMTGTAETEAGEFEKIYNLDVTVIPTNRPIVRKDDDDIIYKTKREKYNAISDDVSELLQQGRAVLVGTASVEVSEVLSKLFHRKGIKHNVLNAKQHAKEAEIVANAGKKGAVTIATNMAGRGTDIKLDPDVKKNGGLAIVGSERHDARRIDRQLRGRAGRQGDPGSSVFYISLEDNLMRLFGGERVSSVMGKLKIPEGEPIQAGMISKSVERAQKKVEENNFGVRKRLLEYDDVMNQQREVIYTRRSSALRGERLKGELFDYIDDMAANWIDEYKPNLDLDDMKKSIRSSLLSELELTKDEFDKFKPEEIIDKIIDAAQKFYNRKEEMLGKDFMQRLEKVAALQTIDDKWREHLRAMDDLKEGIHLRSYGQKDPLLEYKGEAFRLFVELVADINKSTVEFAFKYFPKMVVQPSEKASNVSESDLPSLRNRNVSHSNMQFQHSSTATPSFVTGGVPQQQQPEGDKASTVSRTLRREQPKIGRNDIVKVRYPNGKIVEAKFKKVEKDVMAGSCEILS